MDDHSFSADDTSRLSEEQRELLERMRTESWKNYKQYGKLI